MVGLSCLWDGWAEARHPLLFGWRLRLKLPDVCQISNSYLVDFSESHIWFQFLLVTFVKSCCFLCPVAHVWLAGRGLFYCNAIEGTASAMEMAVIGAKNCVTCIDRVGPAKHVGGSIVMGVPPVIIHFSGISHYIYHIIKPSIFGYPHLWKLPCVCSPRASNWAVFKLSLSLHWLVDRDSSIGWFCNPQYMKGIIIADTSTTWAFAATAQLTSASWCIQSRTGEEGRMRQLMW